MTKLYTIYDEQLNAFQDYDNTISLYTLEQLRDELVRHAENRLEEMVDSTSDDKAWLEKVTAATTLDEVKEYLDIMDYTVAEANLGDVLTHISETLENLGLKPNWHSYMNNDEGLSFELNGGSYTLTGQAANDNGGKDEQNVSNL